MQPDTFQSWDDVPVGVVCSDRLSNLVWIKQPNGDALGNAIGNPLDSGWVNFERTEPSENAYPLTVVGA